MIYKRSTEEGKDVKNRSSSEGIQKGTGDRDFTGSVVDGLNIKKRIWRGVKDYLTNDTKGVSKTNMKVDVLR